MSDVNAFKYKVQENDKILFKKNSGVMKIKNENYPIDLKKLNSTTRYEENEAIVRAELRDAVVSAIKKNGVGGITVHGQGSADPPLVGQYFHREMIICIVDDPKVEGVLDSIASAACTKTKGDGKVFITTVDDALDLCTKERGAPSV